MPGQDSDSDPKIQNDDKIGDTSTKSSSINSNKSISGTKSPDDGTSAAVRKRPRGRATSRMSTGGKTKFSWFNDTSGSDPQPSTGVSKLRPPGARRGGTLTELGSGQQLPVVGVLASGSKTRPGRETRAGRKTNKLHTCTLCKLCWSNLSSLNQHFRVAHPELTKSCGKCGWSGAESAHHYCGAWLKRSGKLRKAKGG